METLSEALIEKTVKSTVQEVTGLPKALQKYECSDPIGTAGPGLAWKLYSAKSKDGHALYPTVCVWVIDKKSLSETRKRAGLSKAAEDAFLDIVRADAARLVRLRHPGVVHVVHALDESKNVMAMVTEPLFASAANVLGNLGNIAELPKELKGLEMGVLEVKHGLLQIAETLDFLHNNAHLVHRAISPEAVLITSNGHWKLGGFGFATSTNQRASDTAHVQTFHYTENDVEDSIMPLQPSLDYTAPELVRSKTSSIGCASDIFSFACLAYHLVAHKPLFDCHNNVKMYMNNLNYLTSESFSSIPQDLVPDLQRMLSGNEASRPSALDFSSSSFFRDDIRLHALRFLDHMLERDNMQKSEFLNALQGMLKDFDSRVLLYKVLPPLCVELRNMVMQPMILPMVFTIAESQDKNDFQLSTLPALLPVLNSAAGETLMLLVKHADFIIQKAGHEHFMSHVVPMLVRAFDETDFRLQEDILKKTLSLVDQIDCKHVIGLRWAARKTIVAVKYIKTLSMSRYDAYPMTEKLPFILKALGLIQRSTTLDPSPPILLFTLAAANFVLKQYGVEFVAEHVLPFLTPLLAAEELNIQQFDKYIHFVTDIMRKIEEKRGVISSDNGIPDSKPYSALSSSVMTKSTFCDDDDDWIPSRQIGDTSTSPPIMMKLQSEQPPPLLDLL